MQSLLRFYALSYGSLALILLDFTFFNFKVFAHFSRFLILTHYHVNVNSYITILAFKKTRWANILMLMDRVLMTLKTIGFENKKKNIFNFAILFLLLSVCNLVA